jgi:hypothetical protein
MTAKTIAEFTAATGREPVNDDMERVNCVEAGAIGHYACGWCKHELPYFCCATCMQERCQPSSSQ